MRERVKTTRFGPKSWHADFVKRVFSAAARNQLGKADLMFVPTWQAVA